MNSDATIYVVFSIDERYVQHCAVTINSLFETSLNQDLSILILYNNISDEIKIKLKYYISDFTSKINFILVDEKSIDQFPVNKHISLATYYRILLPDLLDKSIEKVIFLDCDTIIKKDIQSLWSIDILRYSHASVLESGIELNHKTKIGLKNETAYFNAGVMLINLQYWRKYNVLEKANDYLKKYSKYIKYWDQDILNYIFQSQWLEIHPMWNSTEIVYLNHEWKDRGLSDVKCAELMEAKNDPAIIHFTGSNKPWHYYNNHPCKQDYYYYLSKTPWHSFEPKKNRLLFCKELIKKTVKSLMTLL